MADDEAERPAEPRSAASAARNSGAADNADEQTMTDEHEVANNRTDEPSRDEPTGTTSVHLPVPTRRIASWLMIAAGVVILGTMAWVGWRSYQAYHDLQLASAQVAVLQDQLSEITAVDPAATAATVDRLQAEAADARSAAADPAFGVATKIPWIGPNLATIRDVTVTVDSLATDVMPSVVEVAKTLRPSELAPAHGTIDLAPIERISPLLQQADLAMNQARDRMASIDRSAVIGPVADAVSTLRLKLDAAAEVIEPGARIARLLPAMLGSTSPRTYLVVFQNSAEPRATGGIFGSFAVVHADQGSISILDQGATRTLGVFTPPVADSSPNERALYGDLMAQYPADVNLTADFPTAARLYMEMYRFRTGTTVDGVLALDPVTLSYVLKGAPPVDIGDGATITADNVVATLLSTAYQRFDDKDQSARDAFLAAATAKAFGEVMSGNGNAGNILAGLQRAALERRVLIYSADPAEQADIATTGVSGAIDTDLDASSIGVFLNDGTGAKLGYYLSNEVHVSAGDCRPDGRRELHVTVIMRDGSPADGLPAYVLGSTPTGKAYVLRTNVLVYAPLGGAVVDATRDGTPIGIARGTDQSREVGTTTVELAPGATTELTFTVLAPAGGNKAAGDVHPRLVLTPGVKPWVTSVDPYPECTASTN